MAGLRERGFQGKTRWRSDSDAASSLAGLCCSIFPGPDALCAVDTERGFGNRLAGRASLFDFVFAGIAERFFDVRPWRVASSLSREAADDETDEHGRSFGGRVRTG
jgi:hypothetical protein